MLATTRQVAAIGFSLFSFLALEGCKPKLTGCNDATPAPSVRYGSLNLTPTVGTILPGTTSTHTLWVAKQGTPETLQIDFGPAQQVFEICVKTSPPAVNTHLGVDVQGVLLDPAGGPSTGPGQFWQNVFATLILNPLQDNQTDANGVLKVDVSASSLRSALLNTPPGNPSGRMLFTFNVGATYKLDLSLAKK